MSKRKAYKPKPVSAAVVFKAIQGARPLSKEDKLHLFKLGISAINRMQFGGADVTDFGILCDVLNISTILAQKGVEKQCTGELAEAREAMQDAKQRYLRTNKFVFNGKELQAVKVALNIHNTQLQIITHKEFTEAFEIQEERLKRGDFYHREGDLRIGERAAA